MCRLELRTRYTQDRRYTLYVIRRTVLEDLSVLAIRRTVQINGGNYCIFLEAKLAICVGDEFDQYESGVELLRAVTFREADSIFITSYRLQANVAGLTDNGEVQIWSASRDASEQQLGSCLRKAVREQSRKLRRYHYIIIVVLDILTAFVSYCVV